MKKDFAHRAFKASSGSIASVENLASALSLEVSDFERLWEIPEDKRYKLKELPKSSGGFRTVYNPCVALRVIQRRINTRIFSNPYIFQWPVHLYGSIPKSPNADDEYRSRDYVACAKQHCGARSLLKLDIKDFFDNIHEDVVLSIFRKVLKYPEDVSLVLTRICTHNSKVVQGALTSSYIAMLSLHQEEQSVVDRLRRKGLVYTRFVDDITVSSKCTNYDFSYAQSIIEQMLNNADLPVNTKKTEVQYATAAPLMVHGLRISFNEPRLPSNEVKKIRAAVQGLEIVAKENNYRQTYPYRKDFNRCMGRVNKLGRVKHNQHQKLVRRLVKILPLPSAKEVAYVKTAVERLEATYETKKSSFWYKKHYYRVNDRLNLVKRSYKTLAVTLRKRLQCIPPLYE